MNIRKIIRESIESAINNSSIEKELIQDVVYLNNFSFIKKESKGNSTIWIFEHKEKDYILRFYVQNNKKYNNWNAKLYIYWKELSRDFTSARGKDFEHSFGPFSKYEEMVVELNRKLKNHPMLSTENYVDDDDTQFDKDIVEMIKIMLKHNEEIEKVKDSHFKDLKKIYNEIKNINTIEDLKKYIKKRAPDEGDKQSVLLTLQKIYQLDFYLKKEEMDSLF